MHKYARRAYDMGVRYIGGCCGFEPYHIRAIAEEVGIIFKLNECRAYWETVIRKKSNYCSQRLCMICHSTRVYLVDLLLVFIRPYALSAPLFPLSTPTITILLLTLSAYFSRFPPANTLLKIHYLGLQTGPKLTNITTTNIASAI